jgi:hypothetical protein
MALRKQMGRAQVPDEDILSQLVWLQEMVHAVIVGPGGEMALPEDYTLSEKDIHILEVLGRGEDLLPPLTMDIPTPIELEQAEEITD